MWRKNREKEGVGLVNGVSSTDVLESNQKASIPSSQIKDIWITVVKHNGTFNSAAEESINENPIALEFNAT